MTELSEEDCINIIAAMNFTKVRTVGVSWLPEDSVTLLKVQKLKAEITAKEAIDKWKARVG